MFSNSILGNISFDFFFKNFIAKTYPYLNITTQSELFFCNQIVAPNCTKLENDNSIIDINKNLWLLHFDGSKTNGVGVGSILKDTLGNKFLIDCRLEFKCTWNVVEYESLIQGLKKLVSSKSEESKHHRKLLFYNKKSLKYNPMSFKSPSTLSKWNLEVNFIFWRFQYYFVPHSQDVDPNY